MVIAGGLLQLHHLAQCMVEDDAVQNDDDHDGQESEDGGENHQFRWRDQNEPAASSVFRIGTPAEGRKKPDDDTWIIMEW